MEVPMSLRKPLIWSGAIILFVIVAVAVATTRSPVDEPKIAVEEIVHAIPVKIITATPDNPFDVETYPTGLAEEVAKVAHQRALLVRIADADDIPACAPAEFARYFRRTPLFDFQRVPQSDVSGQSTRHWNDGWVLVHLWNSSNPDRDKMPIQFLAYSAKSRPVMLELPATSDRIHYADIVFPRTPKDELTILSGIALDENGNPIENAWVNLRAYGVTGITSYLKRVFTDKDGRFVFKDIAAQPYQVDLSKRGYAATPGLRVIPAERLGAKHDHIVHYYKMRNVEIEYVYQPDGSRDFTVGDLQTSVATLESIDGVILRDTDGGFCFATGEAVRLLESRWQPLGRPLGAKWFYLRDRLGEITFHMGEFSDSSWHTRGFGFYDAGAVPFDSINEATRTCNGILRHRNR